MDANDYTNVMDDWQVRLIKSRSHQMGLSSHDRDDVTQQIAIETSKFEFDPDRANGAKPETAITALVDRQMKSAARRSTRYQRRIDHLKKASGGLIMETDAKLDLRTDVQTALEGLSERERQVCDMLIDGDSVAEIARALDCGWHAARRLIDGIRKRFADLGLGAWIGA